MTWKGERERYIDTLFVWSSKESEGQRENHTRKFPWFPSRIVFLNLVECRVSKDCGVWRRLFFSLGYTKELSVDGMLMVFAVLVPWGQKKESLFPIIEKSFFEGPAALLST